MQSATPSVSRRKKFVSLVAVAVIGFSGLAMASMESASAIPEGGRVYKASDLPKAKRVHTSKSAGWKGGNSGEKCVKDAKQPTWERCTAIAQVVPKGMKCRPLQYTKMPGGHTVPRQNCTPIDKR